MSFTKNLKRILCVGLASMFFLTGCSKGGDKTADTKGKIIIFQSKVEITKELENAAKEYEKEKGVEVEVWSTTGDDYFQQLKMKLSNEQGPTIMSVAPGSEIEQLDNYLVDLSDLDIAKKIDDSLSVKNADDKVVGIPYTVEGFGIVYNKNLINAETVTDYDSFAKMLQDMKAQGINGFGLSQESYFLIGHILNHPFSIMEDMEGYMKDLSKGKVKMADTKEFQEFAKFYAAIRDNSYNPMEVNYDKECGDFATGKTAAIHQGNWSYSMFADYDMNFEIGMMPFPIMGNDKLAVSVPNSWAINKGASEESIKNSKDFLNWLYTSDTGVEYLTKKFGFIPVVEGTEAADLDPLSATVSEYANSGNIVPWATNLYPAGIVDTYLVPVAQKFFTSDMSAEEFLKELDKAWAEASK